MKDLLKIILVIQVCAVVWAIPYGHSNVASLDEFIIASAIRRGMDGDAVAELLHTKQPVVRVKMEPNGVKKTTTYKLGPDGSISSNTVVEITAVKHFDSDTRPDSFPIDAIHNSPSGTVTRTYTRDDGTTVTQTFGIGKVPKPSRLDNENNGDWFNHFPPAWGAIPGSPQSVFQVPDQPQGNNLHKTTRIVIGPNGEKHVEEKWSSDPEVTPKDHNIRPSNWPNFGFPDFSQHWAPPADTMGDPDDWTVIEENPEVESTNSHKFPPGIPQSSYYPDFPTVEATTTPKPSKAHIEPSVATTLPSLHDFLQNQYGPKTTTTSTTAEPTTSSTKAPVIINIEDLPVADILHNGQPVDENLKKYLPPHLTPILDTGKVLKVENKYPSSTETTTRKVETHVNTTPMQSPEDLDILRNAGISLDDIADIGAEKSPEEPQPEQEEPKKDNTKSHTPPQLSVEELKDIFRNAGIPLDYIPGTAPDKVDKTHKEPQAEPKLASETKCTKVESTQQNLEPQLRNFLRNAGISLDDISSIDGSTITKTSKGPDGRVTTTTYTMRAKPSATKSNEEAKPPKAPMQPPSSISDYLAKLGLTKSDILSKNGQYTKTIIDDDGHVLSATFVLSSPINSETPQNKPYK